MYLMDVNILVYAHRQDIEHHKEYQKWLEFVINSKSDFGYSTLVLSGFLRVVTHPKVFEVPTPLNDAINFVKQIKDQTNSVDIRPKDRH